MRGPLAILAVIATLAVFALGYWCGAKPWTSPEVAQHVAVADHAAQAADSAKSQAVAVATERRAADAIVANVDAVAAVATANRDDAVVIQPGMTDVAQLQSVIEAQAALIEAQRQQIEARDRRHEIALREIVHWQRAESERHREAVALRLALEAQKAATKGAYWRGFAHGAITGAAVGGGIGLTLRR